MLTSVSVGTSVSYVALTEVFFRKSILEYYKEFYAKDFCKKDPPACDWLKGRFKRNTDYALRRVRELRASEPYWHMVGLFYEQMEGINIGMFHSLSHVHVSTAAS